MTVAYFISGLGADERLFKKQFVENLNIKILPWLIPEKNESISSYAQRMAKQIPETGPVILGGVSFGGIMAIEASRYIETSRIIIISSVKQAKEIPFLIRMWKYFPVYKWLGGVFLKKAGIMFRYIFGRLPIEEKRTFIQMVKDSNAEFVSWAADKICNWNRKIAPENLIHFHGTSDLIFPISNIKDPVIPINNGSHLMVLTSPDIINDYLKKYLQKF